MMSDSRNVLVVVAGPTAVGKTGLAVRLAKAWNTAVVSADSRQCYREIPIGTAAPDVSEREGVAHYFIGDRSLEQPWNASAYAGEALALLPSLFANSPVVVMAGGTGFYIDAVCLGMDELPDPDPRLRQDLEEWYAAEGLAGLRSRLQMLDPEYCRRVDLQNPKRLLRALEVCLITGRPYSEQRTGKVRELPFEVLKIALDLPREVLFERIHHRVDAMMQAGLEAEARKVYPLKGLTTLNTVGYRELFAYFDGRCTLGQAITDIRTNTRRYAKRQLTWFRKDPAYAWYSPEDEEAILDKIQGVMG